MAQSTRPLYQKVFLRSRHVAGEANPSSTARRGAPCASGVDSRRALGAR